MLGMSCRRCLVGEGQLDCPREKRVADHLATSRLGPICRHLSPAALRSPGLHAPLRTQISPTARVHTSCTACRSADPPDDRMKLATVLLG